jgi:TolB-like protein
MSLLSVNAFPQSMTLDEAIRTTATELGQRISGNRVQNSGFQNQSVEQTADQIRQQLTAQTKIAVLNFSSNWQGLSVYVIDELNNAIVRNGSLTVVDRQQLDLIRREQNFQMSGEVSDASAQSIGKFLGAQSVLSGSFTKIGNINRFRIRVIDVETGVMQYSNSIDIKKDTILTALTPKAQPTKTPRQRPQRQKPEIFEDYTFFNGLTIFGYTYSPDKPIGFSLGTFGVYTSLGFAVPSWGDYKKTNSSSSYTDIWGTPDYSSTPYTDQRYEIIDWVIGYNVTIIPNILYLPIGVGTEAIKEWRLQILGNGLSSQTEWNPAPQWETSFLFEAGLLFRVKTPINFAPYLFGTYRNIGINKHSFSIGGGGCFDFLANK